MLEYPPEVCADKKKLNAYKRRILQLKEYRVKADYNKIGSFPKRKVEIIIKDAKEIFDFLDTL